MTSALKQIINAVNPKHQYEVEASIEFRRHYKKNNLAPNISALDPDICHKISKNGGNAKRRWSIGA